MSKTLAVLLALALVWLAAWEIAGHFMRQAGIEKLAQADHIRAPAPRLERGADVRVEGTSWAAHRRWPPTARNRVSPP
jgi:hypothetical protein